MNVPAVVRDLPRSITMVRAVLITATVASLTSVRVASAQSPTVTLNSGEAYIAVTQATAGSPPRPGNDNSTRLTVQTGVDGRLVASIDASLPSGVSLRVKVEAPTGAVSMGFVTLDSTPQDVVSGIAAGSYPALTVTYEIIASAQAGTVTLSTCNVLFAFETDS